ncbi:2-succinyl-5-enolpyruvyl-6-hydroxy-3-cyclohexene-1-carboxylic-acid synthase [Arcanobacterium hippocoleae]
MIQNHAQTPVIELSASVAREIIATAVRLGIRQFILCPGSRSAPLAIALAQAEAAGILDLYVETDERVAGFIALGMGKAGKPAAVVTTSGSAVANLHPAVEEACCSAVPMIVISADRPHELRGVRATQTTDQTQILRGSVRKLVDLPAGISDMRAVRNQVRRVVRSALGIGFSGAQGPGPVQLNAAFAPPLHTAAPWNLASRKHSSFPLPEGSNDFDNCGAADFAAERMTAQTQFAAPVQCKLNPKLAGILKLTVIVAGPSPLEKTAEFVQHFLPQIGQIPVLAEPGSALRRIPQAIIAYPQLLHSSLGSQIERVIMVGHPTLTREVSALLSRDDVEVIAVDEPPTFTDISGHAAQIINLADIGAYLTADLDWYKKWERASLQARRIIAKHLAQLPAGDTAQRVNAENAAAVSAESAANLQDMKRKAAEKPPRLGQTEIAIALANSSTPTFYAASSIIREVNLYGSCARQEVYVNRGLAGIDGNISTAIGIAYARREPVRAAVGDLAFIHDLGSLVKTSGENRELDLQVVVLDDGGGSIFATLEYGDGDEAVFERVFRTAKEFDFRRYAQALGAKVKFREFTGSFSQLEDFLRSRRMEWKLCISTYVVNLCARFAVRAGVCGIKFKVC